MSPLARHLEIAPPHLNESPMFAPRGRLIGRDIEVSQILALFDRGERWVSVIGWAGQGKTRLVRAVAEAWRSGGEERQLRFVELGRDPYLLDAIERAFAVREPVMIIVDSGERFDAAIAARIAELLDRSPSAHVLTTSRAPLGAAAEIRYWLAPLSFDAGVELF